MKEQLVNKIQEAYRNRNYKKAQELINELNKIKREEKQSRHNLLRLSNYIRKQCA